MQSPRAIRPMPPARRISQQRLSALLRLQRVLLDVTRLLEEFRDVIGAELRAGMPIEPGRAVPEIGPDRKLEIRVRKAG